MLAIEWPQYVLTALDALERAGYEAWAVGGCVRDALLGRAAHDWDVCTIATPEQMRKSMQGVRLVDTGEKHGTLTAVIGGQPVEITTYRADGAYTDHRRPDGVSFVRSLREDLARRDFTVNAMACHPQRGLADPFGGREDLRAGVIRCVGNANERFEEDGLRLLRALRFAARFRFAIEPETARAMCEKRGLLRFIARERVYSELRGILLADGAAQLLRAYPQVIFAAVPEMERESEQWLCAVDALERAPRDAALRLALLIGADENRAQRVLKSLKADGATRDDVLALVRCSGEIPAPDVMGARRLLHALGLRRARMLCEMWRAQERPGAEEIGRQVEAAAARGDCCSLRQMKIGGEDLLAMGCPPGKAVGGTLAAVLEAVMEGAVENEKQALMQYAKALFQNADGKD